MSFNFFYINSATLRNNLKIIKEISKDTKICFPVKANAYGHGLKEVVSCTTDLVDFYAVASYFEAVDVAVVQSEKPILIFGAIDFERLVSISKQNMHVSVQDLSDITKLETLITSNNLDNVNVHVKVNTGMNRMGVHYAKAKEVIEKVFTSSNVNLIGVYSHLACADDLANELNKKQISRFDDIAFYTKSLDATVLCHLSNSYGMLGQDDVFYDMVRPGILSYGFLPSFDIALKAKQIKPVAELKSKVVKITALTESSYDVGYSRRYSGYKNEKIATIPIGYGDGYLRLLSCKNSFVMINGRYYPVVGSISMDAIAVSLYDNADNIQVDDIVVIISSSPNDKNSVKNLAVLIQTIEYDIVTSLSKRVVRKIV